MGVEYFEDYASGAEYLTHARTITETDIVTFVNLVGFFEPLFIRSAVRMLGEACAVSLE